jgi:hypothetical protein
MGVSGQRHARAALYPRGKDPQYPLDRWLGGPQSRSGHCRGSNTDRPVVQSVVRLYTDWATQARIVLHYFTILPLNRIADLEIKYDNKEKDSCNVTALDV